MKYDYKPSNTSIHIQTHSLTVLKFTRALYTFAGYQTSNATPIDTIKTNRGINNGSNVGSS